MKQTGTKGNVFSRIQKVLRLAPVLALVMAAQTNGAALADGFAGTLPTTTATGCSGTESNLSSLTLSGASFKKVGESLDVNYCLMNFNSASKFDIYIAVQLPDSNMLFLQSTGFFGTPSFFNKVTPYLSNTLIPDKSGTVLSIPTLPMDLGTGTYTFYAIPVLTGKDVNVGFNWVGQLARVDFTLGR
ncbi:MAG: hypothetical protein WC091_16070 [Sulfuricellaceae bacterium]